MPAFRDSYREIHPDPVATPGITWTSGYPVPHRDPNETIDRIDPDLRARQIPPRSPARSSARPAGPISISDHALAVGPSRRGLHLQGRSRPGTGDDLARTPGADGPASRWPCASTPPAARTAGWKAGKSAIVAAGQPAAAAADVHASNDGTDRRSVVTFAVCC